MLIRNAPPTPGSLYVVTRKAQHNSGKSKQKTQKKKKKERNHSSSREGILIFHVRGGTGKPSQ